MVRPCGAVVAKRYEEGRVLRGVRLEFQFVPLLAAQVAICASACSSPVSLPTIVPLPFTLAPKAPFIRLLVGNRYALEIPADFGETTLTKLLSTRAMMCSRFCDLLSRPTI